MVPITCGTSYRNKGVQPLLDAIVDFMPAPTDIPDIKGINPDTEEPEDRRTGDNEPSQLLPSRSLPTRLSVRYASSVSIRALLTQVQLFTTR